MATMAPARPITPEILKELRSTDDAAHSEGPEHCSTGTDRGGVDGLAAHEGLPGR